MENLEKIQEIGTTEKAWIEYAQAIDRNNENIRIALDGIIRKEVLQSTMKRIAIYVPFPNMKLPIFLKVQCASPTVPVFNIYITRIANPEHLRFTSKINHLILK